MKVIRRTKEELAELKKKREGAIERLEELKEKKENSNADALKADKSN